MNAQRPAYTSTRHDDPSASNVRPRGSRRLISYNDENETDQHAFAGNGSTSPQRKASPIPEAHLSRTTAATGRRVENGYAFSRSGLGQTRAATSTSGGLGLWDSWTALQGIASTLLGSDVQPRQPARKNSGGMNASSSNLRRTGSKDLKASKGAASWGPSAVSGPSVAVGSHEDRQALVQAKRREALLLADSETALNFSALHKRRGSDVFPSDAQTSQEQNGETLVYVHQIKAQDTLAGVMIRYQCQPAVFRKVNRLWPNDNIQIRRRVFLPLEACSLRGKKIEPPDILSSDGPLSAPASSSTPPNAMSPTPSQISISNDAEYRTEYFVTLPGIAESIEVARLPRRTLGFFPPSRRKSQTYAILEPDPLSLSPRPSLDTTPRPIQPSPLNPLSLPSPRHLAATRRPRTNSASTRPPHTSFLSHLSGPGGVGSLRPVGPERITQPGPAPDSLNKMFAHRLPNLAPPSPIPRRSSLSHHPYARVRESFDSTHSASSSVTGLENMGGAIEGWVRRVGGKLTGQVEPAEAWRRRNHGIGDLIELEGSSIGGDDDEELRNRDEGLLGMTGAEAGAGAAGGNGSGVGGMTATEEAMLRERFPPRPGGRMVDAQTGSTAGFKRR